jgi:DNA-binding NarL/FixJ family response regulator
MHLYIDDDTDYGVYIQRTYPRALWVNNVHDAYEALHLHNVTHVFLDMHIPSVNTADFAKRLKKLHPNLKILLNTSVVLTDREIETVSKFIDGYVQK